MFTKRSILLLAMCMAAVMCPLTAVAGDLTTGDEFTYVTALPLDGRPYPAYDYSRANRLPAEMTGYWEKSFLLDGVPRTAKVYISAETPIRSYYTVIAIPDGVDTEVFLWKAGWIDMADRRGEALFVLEPGPGMGFFTLELARLVGQTGKVIAVDLQQQMLDVLKRRAEKAGVAERIKVHKCEQDQTRRCRVDGFRPTQVRVSRNVRLKATMSSAAEEGTGIRGPFAGRSA